MRTGLAIAALAAVCQGEKSVITFPRVNLGFETGLTASYFTSLLGIPVKTNGDATTYDVVCTSTECAGFDWPEITEATYTVVAGPSTYRFEYGQGDTTSGCTFTGSPTPTAATCHDINSFPAIKGWDRTQTYPAPTSDVLLNAWNIGYVTLTVGASSDASRVTTPATTGSDANGTGIITSPPELAATTAPSRAPSRANVASTTSSGIGSALSPSALLTGMVAAGVSLLYV